MRIIVQIIVFASEPPHTCWFLSVSISGSLFSSPNEFEWSIHLIYNPQGHVAHKQYYTPGPAIQTPV